MIGKSDVTKFYKGEDRYKILMKTFEENIGAGNEWAFSTAIAENSEQYLCMIREDDDYEMEAIKEQAEKDKEDYEFRLQFEK